MGIPMLSARKKCDLDSDFESKNILFFLPKSLRLMLDLTKKLGIIVTNKR
jgi:hypothetical protein